MNELTKAVFTYFHRISTYNPMVVAIELLLIGIVVWWVMHFLRGTRGARLFKGVSLVLITVYVVIRLLPPQLGWDRIKFLYGNFLLFTLVGVVVAFQPEVRRALLQIGQANFFKTKRTKAEVIINELITTMKFLSRNKIGAVIAVERSAQLGEIIQAGTRLDAIVSSHLINTIFYPGSALHDLGIIIRDDRILAAGCQFPLAESDEVDQSLGSRHRAALGLAKDCDAIVLVVSEETGRMSLACDGQLYLGLEADAMKDLLLGLLAPRKMPRKRKLKTDEDDI